MQLLEVGGRYYTESPRYRAWFQSGENLDGISLNTPKSRAMKRGVDFPRPLCAAKNTTVFRGAFNASISNLHQRSKTGSGR
jgi:hypothetical protein